MPLSSFLGSSPQRGFASVQEERVAHALGWFSIGLGVAQLLAPRGLSRLIGVNERPGLMRAMGARELASGLGILGAPRPTGWLWSRVGGDALDLAMLAAALVSPGTRRSRTTLALAAVAGVAVLDLMSSQRSASHPRAEVRGRTRAGTLPAEASLIVNDTPDACYWFWRDLSNLPRFMRHIESVQVLDEKRSRWVAGGPAGSTIEWVSQIVEDVEGQRIAWRSEEGATVSNAGVVRFEPAPGGRGTIVRVQMHYRAPAGELGATVAALTGEAPQLSMREDLRRFKRYVETGEVPTIDGQPAGRRDAVARLLSKVAP